MSHSAKTESTSPTPLDNFVLGSDMMTAASAYAPMLPPVNTRGVNLVSDAKLELNFQPTLCRDT